MPDEVENAIEAATAEVLAEMNLSHTIAVVGSMDRGDETYSVRLKKDGVRDYDFTIDPRDTFESNVPFSKESFKDMIRPQIESLFLNMIIIRPLTWC